MVSPGSNENAPDPNAPDLAPPPSPKRRKLETAPVVLTKNKGKGVNREAVAPSTFESVLARINGEGGRELFSLACETPEHV